MALRQRLPVSKYHHITWPQSAVRRQPSMRLAKRPQAKSRAEVGTLRILIEAHSISAFDDWLRVSIDVYR